HLQDLWYPWLFAQVHEFIARRLPRTGGRRPPAVDAGCGTRPQSLLLAPARLRVGGLGVPRPPPQVAPAQATAPAAPPLLAPAAGRRRRPPPVAACPPSPAGPAAGGRPRGPRRAPAGVRAGRPAGVRLRRGGRRLLLRLGPQLPRRLRRGSGPAGRGPAAGR